jgi:hypothetical protein
MRSFPTIAFDGLCQTYDLIILWSFVSSEHMPSIASDRFLLLLHLFLTVLAITKCGSCAARKHKRETT